MCYDVVKCDICGEWLDEYNAAEHVCMLVEAEEPVIEKPIEIVVSNRKRRGN